MKRYFEYNGISSNYFSSIVVQELPNIVRAPMRYNEIKIDGLDGFEYKSLGYESYPKLLKIGIVNITEIDSINKWLNGKGNLILSNEPDKVYRARLYSQINWERLGRFRTADITFMVEPFKYLKSEPDSSSLTLINQGTIKSKPYIKITGSGTTTLAINGTSVCTLAIDSGYLELDSESQECYCGGTLKNRNMSGGFPEFVPGTNIITFTGGTVTTTLTKIRSRFI